MKFLLHQPHPALSCSRSPWEVDPGAVEGSVSRDRHLSVARAPRSAGDLRVKGSKGKGHPGAFAEGVASALL